jgi:N-methylhydantoinase A
LKKPRQHPSDHRNLTKNNVNPIGRRSACFQEGQIQCQVYHRAELKSDHTLEGPAIIQEKEATTLIDPQWTLRVDKFGNMVIEKV